LGAPKVIDDKAVAVWRQQNSASIADTAKHGPSILLPLRERVLRSR
jgi:hypothetical protein